MYSINPLPIVDTLNSHEGFWILFCFFAIINILGLMSAIAVNSYKEFTVMFVLSASFMNFIGYHSWNTGEIKIPKNEKIIATLKGFIAEGEAYTEKSGKQTVKRENHYLYVAYNVEGQGDVTIRAVEGITYPEKAILYKN